MLKASTVFTSLATILTIFNCFEFSLCGKFQRGQFIMKTKNALKCDTSKSPIQEQLCENNFHVTKISRTKEALVGYVNHPKNVTIENGTLTADILKDGGFKPFFRKDFKKPCEHPVLGRLMQLITKPDKKCTVKKGNYTISALDIDRIAHTMIGQDFFYVTLSVLIEWYTKQGLVCCAHLVFEFIPLNKKVKAKK